MTDAQRTARIAQLTIEITNYNKSIENATSAQSYSSFSKSKTMTPLDTLVKLRDKAQAEKNQLENDAANVGNSGIQFVQAVPRDY